MENSFNELGISAPILKALEDIGYKNPTEVQSMAIPHILNREDLIVKSKTGSGKTAVFGIPLLQLTNSDVSEPQALVLTPTRELAVQIDNDLKQFAKHLKHKTTSVYGQHNIKLEIQALSSGTSIVTGTPGRVYDHVKQGNLKTKNIKFLVLDEADRMLDMGFLDQVVKIIRAIPKERVTLLFSATIPPDMNRICRDYMKQPSTIEIESPTMTVDTIEQVYYRVEDHRKNSTLGNILLVEQPESCIIFCNTKNTVDRVQRFLQHEGYASHSLHGDIPQTKRLNTIQQFKKGDFHILVATDVAARGIHIEGLSLVINYDVPIEKDSYVHRIGRTGRAGKLGRAISLVTTNDIMTIYEIEEHIGTLIEEGVLPQEAEMKAIHSQALKWIEENTQKLRGAAHSIAPFKAKENKPGRNKINNSDNHRDRSSSQGKSIKSTQTKASDSISRPINTHSGIKPAGTSSSDKPVSGKTTRVTRTVHVGGSKTGSTTSQTGSTVRTRSAIQTGSAVQAGSNVQTGSPVMPSKHPENKPAENRSSENRKSIFARLFARLSGLKK